MKIGILGSGSVGKTLGTGLIKHSFEVMIGSRNPAKLLEWCEETGNKAFRGTFAEAGAFGEIIILAVKGECAGDALRLAGAQSLKNKIIIDTTNPIADSAPENGVLGFFTDFRCSLMEKSQQSFPDTYFVKAFNSVGSGLMVNPDFNGQKPTMFICGNRDSAKKAVQEILEIFGWEVEDMGGAESARAIEPLCILWCIPGLRENRWTHAFKLLKK